MATLNLFRHRFYKNDGTLNAGGKVYTYVPGTTTLKTTYTDSTAGTPNTNPIILDSKGEADIWQTGKIKVNVLQSDDTQVTGFPVDDIGYLIIGDEIHASPNKTTPVDGDEIGIWNSITQVLNRVTFANLWAYIQPKLAAPGAIGGTTPAAGSFTTLNSTGGALNGTLGATTPNTIAATTISASGLITTTGGQIKFPATAVPSADANTLDDYEEGTFTPNIIGQTSQGAATYTTQLGKYTKIGNIVHFKIHLLWTAHTGTGMALISQASMPFTPSNDSMNSSCFIGYVSNFTQTASNVMMAQIAANGSGLFLYQYPVGGGAASQITLDVAAELELSGSYWI